MTRTRIVVLDPASSDPAWVPLADALILDLEEGEDVMDAILRGAGRCAACSAPMFVAVRGHHHSEEGRDVTGH